MREDLLKSAVSFLTSPNVQSAEKEKKIQFLKKKGLDDEEIEEAFKRAGSTTTATTATAQPATTSTGAVATTATTTPAVNKPLLPSRPTTVYQLPPKVIYYPPPAPARMTTKQLVGWIVILGFGAVGVTATLVMVVKKCMMRIFNKIGAYQGDRYKQYERLLSKVKGSMEENTVQNEEDNTATTVSLLDSCVQEQKNLAERLDQLTLKLKSSELAKDDRCTDLKTTLEEFRTAVLRHPTLDMQSTFSSDYYTASNGGLTSSYANRYKNDNTNNTAIQSIKSEIRSIKGALLSRRNFPTVSLPIHNNNNNSNLATSTANTTTNTTNPASAATTNNNTAATNTNATTSTSANTANTTTATTATTATATNTAPSSSSSSSTPTTPTSANTTDASSQPGYHPRNRRSFRSDLSSTATTVEDVKDEQSK